jgi:pilus assembly protein CpaC
MTLRTLAVSLLFSGLFSGILAGQNTAPAATRIDLVVTVNKSIIIESIASVKRLSTANGEVAEAVAVSGHEVVVNGKLPGETSIILWDSDGKRTIYDVRVLQSQAKVDSVRKQLEEELPGQPISLTVEDGSAVLRGSVKDVPSSERAVAIAGLSGKVTNLLRIAPPPPEPQILLRVRFANVDRSVTSQLAANLLSTGATNTIGSISTGQAASPIIQPTSPSNFSISDALNIFLYRKDLNLGTVIRALEAKQLVQILAEPNLMTMSGKTASFLAGGEFPYPTLQGGGSGVGQITVQFREFGIRVQFLPTVTARGTIRLVVTPEVSSLDVANGLTVQGFTVPGLDVRRVQTEVELVNGQSFVIAGLMDNRLTETINRIPGLANIPLLGKLFQSRSITRNNSELLVLVTPEIVDPSSQGLEPPALSYPKEFLKVPPMRLPPAEEHKK